MGLRGRILARLLAHLPFRTRAADIDADEGSRLDAFGISGSILYTPGHTPGSISGLLDSGDAIVGDVIMGGWAGGAIRPSQPNFHYFADGCAAGGHGGGGGTLGARRPPPPRVDGGGGQ